MIYGTCKYCNKRVILAEGNIVCYHKRPNNKFNTCCGSMNDPVEGSIVECEPFDSIQGYDQIVDN